MLKPAYLVNVTTIINNYDPEATVIISTHLITDVEKVLDEAVFINNGKVILHESTDDIREKQGMGVDELFRETFKKAAEGGVN